MQTRRFGATYFNGQTTFSLWAPSQPRIELLIEGREPIVMPQTDGWHEITVECRPGDKYQYLVGKTVIADPAATAQAGRVRGWSMVTDPQSYRWTNTRWTGRPWREAVFYEVHPGLCGGFKGIADRLPEIAALGFTAVELMPIAQFPGNWNWGYDGVLAFAPDRSYGSPDDLKAMVDTAHGYGLMVFLDVVYNHFGPDGNFLPTSTPEFFREDIHTPWGSAIDFRRPEVRQFYEENVETWLGEFRFDGLRFDAVHAIEDEGWLTEMAAAVRTRFSDRHVHLVLENDDNIADFLRQGFDAQWNDDYHHVLHVMLTGETAAYYADYAETPAEKLARALQEGFIYQGDASPFRDGIERGTPSADLRTTAFVNFLQNHDQIGNRAFGERLITLCPEGHLKAAIALLLLSPHIPLVFMGEEIGSRAPFHYFVDHNPDLIESIREGRKREFKKLIAHTRDLPEPNAVQTFENSMPETDAPDRDRWKAFYRALLDMRARHIAPHLDDVTPMGAEVIGEKAVRARWRLADASLLEVAVNLGDEPVSIAEPACTAIFGRLENGSLPAGSTVFWLAPAQRTDEPHAARHTENFGTTAA
ncbi:MAG: malto-oligosyltrehalose trehalohydrolase [Beijerinckiaceae bacterium]|nr:malto-oligosyltrehalose trehalohydrolase [Beijerinckiaceae bacterium]